MLLLLQICQCSANTRENFYLQILYTLSTLNLKNSNKQKKKKKNIAKCFSSVFFSIKCQEGSFDVNLYSLSIWFLCHWSRKSACAAVNVVIFSDKQVGWCQHVDIFIHHTLTSSWQWWMRVLKGWHKSDWIAKMVVDGLFVSGLE